MIIYFIFTFISKIFLSQSLCIEGENNCSKCNPITKLCIKCLTDVYSPDEKGGCQNSRKCISGKSNCLECNSESDLCKKCEEGNFPDKNGGCSYTDNCEISEKGKCLKCKENFILVGEVNYFNQGIKICKSLNLEIFKNCATINIDTGYCTACKEGYYLGEVDQKCCSTEFCTESIFNVCTKCNFGYYLDIKEGKCKEQNGIFQHCRESIDGKTCNICDEDYYFDENGKCIAINNCLRATNFICEECKYGYFLSIHKDSCTNTKNCYSGNKDLSICDKCEDNYYIDYQDGKCKSNIKDNEFKYCKEADNICYKCIIGYELGKDNKCSNSKNCAESDNRNCIECIENYYLGLDNICTDIEHCIYSEYYECVECKENYFYDINDKKCKYSKLKKFENCKSGYEIYNCIYFVMIFI